jgi:hypothetical protein
MVSCTKSSLKETDYFKYINNPENGLVKSREINGFRLQMKYYSPDLQALQEIGHADSVLSDEKKDSLVAGYKNGLAFLFSILELNPQPGKDVVQYGVFSEREFKERFNRLHFNINEHFWISNGKETVPPGLSILESTFELSGPKTFYLVFEDTGKEEEIDVVFNDVFFDTGISHFIFKRRDIRNLPNLSF